MSEPLLLWGLGLLAAAVLLVIVEVFIPSGGLIAVMSAGSAIAGVVVLFNVSTTWGLIGALVVLVLAPAAFAFSLKVWPHTPIGKRLVLGDRTEEEIAADAMREVQAREVLDALVGAEGVAISDLRPVGKVQIDGQRYDALSESTLIRAGTRVRVTFADGSQIKVRPVA